MKRLKKKYIYIHTKKNGLVGLNNNTDEKQTNQNFLIKFIRILVEITRILINIIILIKIRSRFSRFYQKFLIRPFSTRNFFQCIYKIKMENKLSYIHVILNRIKKTSLN